MKEEALLIGRRKRTTTMKKFKTVKSAANDKVDKNTLTTCEQILINTNDHSKAVRC